MIGQFLTFEWIYRKRRAATYVYLLVVLCFSSFLVDFFSNNEGEITSHFFLYKSSLGLSIILMPIMSAIMGVSIIRDIEFNMGGLLFTKPFTKFQYFFGRYLSSLLILFVLFLGVPIGQTIRHFISAGTPTAQWQEHNIAVYFVVWLPNLIFYGTLFYCIAVISKNRSIIYSQGFLLLILEQLSFSYLRGKSVLSPLNVLDISGVRAFSNEVYYISTSAENSWHMSPLGMFAKNRYFILGFSALIFAAFYRFFKFQVSDSFETIKKQDDHEATLKPSKITFTPAFKFDTFSYLKKLLFASLFYVKMISREFFFRLLALIAFSLFFLFVYQNLFAGDQPVLATSFNLIRSVLNSSLIVCFVLVIYYANDIIFKDQNHNISSIVGVSPIDASFNIVSKSLGVGIVIITYLIISNVLCIILQNLTGTMPLKFEIYLTDGFLTPFIELTITFLAAIFIQMLMHNRGVGPIVSIVLIYGVEMLISYGIENPLYLFNTISGNIFTDFGIEKWQVKALLYGKMYWLFLSIFLFCMSILIQPQPNDKTKWFRFKSLGRNLNMPLAVITSISLFSFMAMFLYWFYYQTFKNEKYVSKEAQNLSYFAYEKANIGDWSKPTVDIISADLNIKLLANRQWSLSGVYRLKNNTPKALKNFDITEATAQAAWEAVKFTPAKNVFLSAVDDKSKKRTFSFDQPLQPGDSSEIGFELVYNPPQFYTGTLNRNIGEKDGLFIAEQILPKIGFDKNKVIWDETLRKENKLNEYADIPVNNAVRKSDLSVIVSLPKTNNLYGLPFTPFKSSKKHKQYIYQAKNRSLDFALVSSRFKETTVGSSNMDIGYVLHPEHLFNKKQVHMAANKTADFMAANFGPLPKIYVVETPLSAGTRYSTFEGLINLKENALTTSRFDFEKEVDKLYQNVSQNVAMQWFGYSVQATQGPGEAFIERSIAAYLSGLMLKRDFGRETSANFFKSNLLVSRNQLLDTDLKLTSIKKGQLPRSYIISKGVAILRNVEQIIGEAKVLEVFKEIYSQYGEKKKTLDIDTLEQFFILKCQSEAEKKNIKEIFNEIYFYDLRIVESQPVNLNENLEAEFTIVAKKFKTISKTAEKQIKIDHEVELGFLDQTGKLAELHKIRLPTEKNLVKIKLKTKATKIRLDPNYYLFDIRKNDNEASFN